MLSISGLLPSPTSLLNNGPSLIPAATSISPTILSSLPKSTILYAALDTMNFPVSTSAMMAVTTTAAIKAGDVSSSGAENGECQLLGPFALFIQGALGALALLSLVYKRWRERPQRPVKIWAFDASKQVFGSILLHIANLFMSMLSSGQIFTTATISTAADYQANPCSFYLLNLAIDTTIGIPILIVLLRLLTYGFSLTPVGNPPESIQSGNYGRPPKTFWWLKQSFIYFIGLLGMKLCVFFVFKICPWIVRVGDWALKWTEGNETVQVFFVMLFFPVIMNAIQYYIIDGFIKDQKPTDHQPIPEEDVDDDDDAAIRRRGPTDQVDGTDGAFDDESEDEIAKKTGEAKTSVAEDKSPVSDKTTKPKVESKRLDEYDPATDGEENPAVIGSIGSSSGEADNTSTNSRDATSHADKRSGKGVR